MRTDGCRSQKRRRSCRRAISSTTSELFSQVGLDLGNILANLGVELDVALQKLGFDRVFELARDLASRSRGHRCVSAMVWLSTRLSSISTPSVGRGLLTNL